MLTRSKQTDNHNVRIIALEITAPPDRYVCMAIMPPWEYLTEMVELAELGELVEPAQ